MKAAILSILIFISVGLNAQTEATVNVSVRLKPLMSISVNQLAVAFDIDTEAEYIDGAEKTILDHLNTFSTDGYQVTARYSTSDLAAGTISVTASGVNNVVYGPAVPLTETSQPLFTSANGLGRKSHDVKYRIKGGLHDQAMGSYETVVVYEIIAD